MMAMFRVLMVWLLAASAPLSYGAGLDDSRAVVSATVSQAIASQERIDDLAVETARLLQEYRRLLEGVEYETAHRRELESLEQTQREEIAELKQQIATASVTRQRIAPLMRSMVESLQRFVVLDLPFQQEQRLAEMLRLQHQLGQPDLPASVKLRLVLEAYQVEQDYGHTIDAWRGSVALDGENLSVEFLRVGRLALYFQRLDGSGSGYWDAERGAWLVLPDEFNRPLARALRVARNQGAPEFLLLPLVPEEGES